MQVTQCLVPQSSNPTWILYSSIEEAVAVQKSSCATPRRNSRLSTGAPMTNMSALITTSRESGWQSTLTVFTCSCSCWCWDTSCEETWLCRGYLRGASCVECVLGKAKPDRTQSPDSKTSKRRWTRNQAVPIAAAPNTFRLQVLWPTRQWTKLSRAAFSIPTEELGTPESTYLLIRLKLAADPLSFD